MLPVATITDFSLRSNTNPKAAGELVRRPDGENPAPG
jgi:hypothetical protein